MAKDWENLFSTWAQPPSKTEQDRCERVIREIKSAVQNSIELQKRKILVFTQGSFRNRVNVRQESDVDVGVMSYESFLVQYPQGKGDKELELYDVGDTFFQFKNELEDALVEHFGRAAVKRGNKAFDIKASKQQVEADVVPLKEFRQYWSHGSYRAGVALIPDEGSRIENFPERLLSYWPNTPLHYENGVEKNRITNQRFKGLVRILKKLRIELEEAGSSEASVVPGYLLECLVWNAPDRCFSHSTWENRVQSTLRFIWQKTKDPSLCNDWCEVDNVKYLFRIAQPWTRDEAHNIINSIWDYVGVKKL